MIIVSVLAAALAAGLWALPVDRVARRRWAGPTQLPVRPGAPRLVAVLLVTGGALVVAAIGFGSRGVAVTASLLAVGGTAAQVGRSVIRGRGAAAARTEVAHACQVLARLVAAGQTPSEALRTAAEDCPVLAESASMQRVGGDPVDVWRRASGAPGHAGLIALARAWSVTHVTGAAMARPLGDVAVALRSDRVVSNVVQSELAAPRATGRLMALLPLAGLGLGYLIGGDPVRFLIDSWVGQICLVLGVALACAGVMWVERLASGPTGTS